MGLNMQTEIRSRDQIVLNYLDLKVIPSYHCDMNCNYCYNNTIQNKYCEDTINLIKNLTNVIEKYEKEVVIELIGGEPLSSHSYAITDKILDHIMSLKNEKVKVVLQTGSSNLRKIKDSLEKIDGLSYSVDISGSHKAHNLNKLEELVVYCNDYEVPLQIQTVLSLKDTIEDIDNFINTCRSYGVKWLGLGYPQFQKYNSKEIKLQTKIYSDLINGLDKYKNIYVGGNPLQSILDFLGGWGYETSCYCGEKCITIEPDGRISPCLYLRPDDFKSIDTFLIIKHKREKALRDGECSNCEMWAVCHGGCMVNAMFLMGDINCCDKIQCKLMKNLVDTVRLPTFLKT